MASNKMETDIKPWLLSKILDKHFVGKKEDVNMKRKFITFAEYIYNTFYDQLGEFYSGSYGEGFHTLCSDVDVMLIDNKVIVMYPDLYLKVCPVNTIETILLASNDECKPGFVKLEVAHLGLFRDLVFTNSIVPLSNSTFLSSDIFREEALKYYCYDFEGESVGPSSKVQCKVGNTVDMVFSFPCVFWPSSAYEWVNRDRVFGWPTNVMVDQIVRNGCHVVPVGDRCSGDTLLPWRISFAAAERFLVHSLSHAQFQVYGLLKYLLNQIKFRMKTDIGDDILCSYHIKTLIFYAVESSPQSFWQEKNIIVCFWFCFTMLLDWVNAGYCPNYFIKTCNMFQRKVHGESKLKLQLILDELHQMKINCLSVGNVYQPSIWDFLHSTSALEHLMHPEKDTKLEYTKDFQLCSCMRELFAANTRVETKTKAAKLLCKSESATDEAFTYFMLVKLLCHTSMKQFEKYSGNSGNRKAYKTFMKCKRWLTASFGSDQLYLATFHYQTGNFNKALEMADEFLSSVFLYSKTLEYNKRYHDTYCGKSLSTFQKMKKAFGCDLSFSSSDVCPPNLYLEVQSQFPMSLTIPPKPYAMYLMFLCYYSLGANRKCCDILHDLDALINDNDRGPVAHWIVHTLLGICYQIMGDNLSAINAFRVSLLVSFDDNPALGRIEALEAYLSGQKNMPN